MNGDEEEDELRFGTGCWSRTRQWSNSLDTTLFSVLHPSHEEYFCGFRRDGATMIDWSMTSRGQGLKISDTRGSRDKG